MKIAIFEGSYQTTPFINRLIEGLTKLGITIYVLGFNEHLSNPIKNVKYISLGSNQSYFSFVKSSLLLGFTNSFQKGISAILFILKKDRKKLQQQNLNLVLQKIQPDIVHVQWPSLLVWMQPYLKKRDFKIILSERGYHVNVKPFVDADNLAFLRSCYPYIDGFHSVTKALANVSNKIYQNSNKLVKVVYTGVNLNNFTYHAEATENKKIKMLSVGRQHWVKGYDIAVRAMHQLKLKNIEFEYQIIGANNDEELLFLIDDLGLMDEVQLLTKLPQKKVFDLMNRADLLLVSSIEEGIANVAVEAMALGTPVIATNCGGMEELITHEKEGWIVPIRSPEAIANQIVEFINLNAKELEKLKLAARKKVSVQHSEELMIDGMLELYNLVHMPTSTTYVEEFKNNIDF
jgi:colanic acid/amylovoran biosynthesis glycosyltransferase